MAAARRASAAAARCSSTVRRALPASRRSSGWPDGRSPPSTVWRVREQWAGAFCASGASQCGFCTPGIIVRLDALRPAAPAPTTSTRSSARCSRTSADAPDGERSSTRGSRSTPATPLLAISTRHRCGPRSRAADRNASDRGVAGPRRVRRRLGPGRCARRRARRCRWMGGRRDAQRGAAHARPRRKDGARRSTSVIRSTCLRATGR